MLAMILNNNLQSPPVSAAAGSRQCMVMSELRASEPMRSRRRPRLRLRILRAAASSMSDMCVVDHTIDH